MVECTFCGGQGTVNYDNADGEYSAYCQSCRKTYSGFLTEQKAIAFWDRKMSSDHIKNLSDTLKMWKESDII